MAKPRTSFLRKILGPTFAGVGFLANVVAAVAQPAVSGPSINWDLATHTTPAAGATAAIAPFVEALATRAGGKFNIKVAWDGPQ